MHATRDRLLARVGSAPGATLAELARDAGVAHSTATHHVGALAASGLVDVERHRGRAYCFPCGAAPGDRARSIGTRLGRARDVLARLSPEAAPLGRVARGLGMTKAGVLWHLRRLASLGLVEVEAYGGGRGYRLCGASPVSSAARNSAADA